MPEKTRLTRATFSGPEAWRSERVNTLQTYHPSCDRPPWLVTTAVNEHAESSQPVTYVKESHWISGKLGLPTKGLPFNGCHHLVSRLKLTEGGQFKINRLTLVDYERDDFSPGECGLFDFIKSTYSKDEKIVLTNGPSFWLGLMGSGNSPLTTDPYLPIGTSSFETKVSELDGIALESMVPKLDDGFSLPLFVAELLSVKALVVNALRLLKTLPSALLSLIRSGLTLKQLSNGWLEAVFGWLPLVSDLKTIVSKLMSMRTAVVRFLKGADTVKTLHFKKGLAPTTFRPESWFANVPASALVSTHEHPYKSFTDIFEEIGFEASVSTSVTDLDYTATMRFEYRIPEAESLIAPIWAAFDHWGVNLSPSDVWEFIPFSFVVDWFLSVGPMIARLDKTNLQVQVVIYDFCRSFKYRFERKGTIVDVYLLDHDGNDVSTFWTTPDLEPAVWTVDSYYRVVGIPNLTHQQLLDWRIPRGYTLVTASALTHQLFRERLLRLLQRR